MPEAAGQVKPSKHARSRSCEWQRTHAHTHKRKQPTRRCTNLADMRITLWHDFAATAAAAAVNHQVRDAHANFIRAAARTVMKMRALIGHEMAGMEFVGCHRFCNYTKCALFVDHDERARTQITNV